jgi:hypothetical protein
LRQIYKAQSPLSPPKGKKIRDINEEQPHPNPSPKERELED